MHTRAHTHTHTHTGMLHINTVTTYSIGNISYLQVTIVSEPFVDAGDNGGGGCLLISNERGAENTFNNNYMKH